MGQKRDNDRSTPQKVKVNVERLFVLDFDVEQSEG